MLERYMLMIHRGKLCTAEGETGGLEFRGEIKQIGAALQEAGIDTTQRIHAEGAMTTMTEEHSHALPSAGFSHSLPW
ncbi:hypothetical protein BZM27_21525 [Paraburkholderia steynii]|uniref:Uncharacterized protein n=1 Tax=Paraburkholderia steynii TaxID=1245441 RepID=A0A4R0XJ24_9BURK|nr:hypothetical protein BZM27_21525 [Paraburkholderia steynii]